jgi:hypothetical protein
MGINEGQHLHTYLRFCQPALCGPGFFLCVDVSLLEGTAMMVELMLPGQLIACQIGYWRFGLGAFSHG